MRTPRIFLAILFLIALFFVFCRSLITSVARHNLEEAAKAPPKPANSRISALFSFNSGFSLFSPNAAISLTDDNSTSFPAQPAAFGPKLPHNGLSAPLWIGSGFTDDSLQGDDVEGELGCSDILALQSTRPAKFGLAPKSATRRFSRPSAGAAAGRNHRERRGNLEGDTYEDVAVDDRPTDDEPNDTPREVLIERSDTHGGPGPFSSGSSNAKFHKESAEIRGKVVLLSRGGCGFLEKVLWAQRRGATALIVGDNQKGGPLIQMYARGDTSNVSIPSVFTARTTAHLLSSLTQPGSFLVESVDAEGRAVVEVRQPDIEGSGSSTLEFDEVDKVDPESSPTTLSEVNEATHSNESIFPPKPPKVTWWHKLFGRRNQPALSSFPDKITNPLSPSTSESSGDVPAEDDWSGTDESSEDAGLSRPIKRTTSGKWATASVSRGLSFKNSVYSATTNDGRMIKSTGEGSDPAHEGLWVTITPSNSGNPFFDTLLVLVVSPLVTLSIVYTMLIVRARIRRRRWRAPKSIVEQLPVRTYHTVPASSMQSSRAPSPDSGSPTTPLLQQSDQGSRPPTRPRPRSRTASNNPGTEELTTQSPIAARLGSPSRQQHEKSSGVSSQWKKYMGRQVECVVCLEEYVDGVSQVMGLPCGHEFHAECITPWLTTRRRTCPICKGDVVRSLARGPTSGPRYEPYHDENDDEDDDDSDNEDEGEASGNGSLEDDVEQGTRSSIPRGRPTRTEAFLMRLSASLGVRSQTGEPSQTREDRDR